MTAGTRIAPRAPAGPLPSRHPEQWLWIVSGAGCLVLGAHSLHGGITTDHGAARGAHGLGWLAMTSVMLPLIADNVRHAALRSPQRSRRAVMAHIVTGWAAVWAGAAGLLGIGVGALLGIGAGALGRAASDVSAVALLTLTAAGWQYTSVKRRSLARCHAVLAPPLDRRRSRRTCLRYGLRLGQECVQSCGPLMALVAVTAHNPLVVAACTGLAWYERRRRPHHDPATRATSVVILLTGAAVVAAGLLV